VTIPERARPWWAATFALVSVVAVMAACFSTWFEWRHRETATGMRTGLGLPLPRFDYSAVASFTTATPADAETVGYVTWSARGAVTLVLLTALAAVVRSGLRSATVWPRVWCFLVFGFTVFWGLVLLFPGWLWAAGFNDVDYTRINDTAPVELVRVAPQGPILLAVAVLAQAATWWTARTPPTGPKTKPLTGPRTSR
jgi:hypothetical protein